MIERADMPGPGDPGIDGRETMQRHQHRWFGIAQARVDHFSDAAMIGIEDRRTPHLRRFARERFVAGDDGRFADARDRTRYTWRRVAVDHQPRVTLRDQMRIEM